MKPLSTTRRNLLASVPAALATVAVGSKSSFAKAADTQAAGDEYQYEVTRTDDEWREMLTEDEFKILRLGATEQPQSHPLWDSTEAGIYSCKGCDLPLYDARFKVVIETGWLFYRHSFPAATMTDIDKSVYAQFAGNSEDVAIVPTEVDISNFSEEERALLDPLLSIEVHCRRCASHLGHLVYVQNKLVHCINGLSMNFAPASA